MASPMPSPSPPCAICAKPVSLPDVDGVPSDLAFKLLKMAVEWHLNTQCEEAFTVGFGKHPAKGLLRAQR